MRLVSRPLAPAETDYELVALAVSGGGLGLAVCWFALQLPWPICFFHAITGYPCLTCGATRSAIACFHAQFLTAFKWNPLAFLSYAGIILFNIYAAIALMTGRRRLRAWFSPNEKKIARTLIIAGLLTNWAYLIVHTGMFKS